MLAAVRPPGGAPLTQDALASRPGERSGETGAAGPRRADGRARLRLGSRTPATLPQNPHVGVRPGPSLSPDPPPGGSREGATGFRNATRRVQGETTAGGRLPLMRLLTAPGIDRPATLACACKHVTAMAIWATLTRAGRTRDLARTTPRSTTNDMSNGKRDAKSLNSARARRDSVRGAVQDRPSLPLLPRLTPFPPLALPPPCLVPRVHAPRALTPRGLLPWLSLLPCP